ncbi:CCT6B, partial [Symbiodinium sp. KB8]
MSALSSLNPGADHTAQAHALAINVSAGKGLSEVLKSNLGPRGTLKMLVDGAGAVKLTKDGSVLLHQMQIQHPTAIMIARTATAQDDETGDGTTSAVLFTGELLKYAERVISDGVHPRTVADGLDMAKDATLAFLDSYKTPVSGEDKELLLSVAKTALRTKLQPDMADQLADIVTEAVLTDSRLVKGLVLDHGAHPPHPSPPSPRTDMPKLLENPYILTCNISLEYEKSEVTATQVFSTAAERDRLADAERAFVDEKVRRIIDLKRSVCTPENGRTFVVVNQKGIDPPSLDMLAKEGIIGIRRELDASVLGSAGRVYEQTLGDDKYTFVEGVENPFSCTILMKGPNAHTIAQLKDAVRDGLRAVRNTIEDGAVVAGAGAFEVAAAEHLQAFAKKE